MIVLDEHEGYCCVMTGVMLYQIGSFPQLIVYNTGTSNSNNQTIRPEGLGAFPPKNVLNVH